MEIRYAITTPDELRQLCIKNGWFTAGSNEQYEKLFELNDTMATTREVALVIWLCSEDADIEEIQKKLMDEKVDYQNSRLLG